MHGYRLGHDAVAANTRDEVLGPLSYPVQMPITTSVYIATSLDGFIARKDGSIDWLMEANQAVPEGEDCGYAAFMSSVDVLIMGRNTYEQVAGFEPWPYAGKRVVVLTSRAIRFREGPDIHLESSSEPPPELLQRLSAEGCRHAYVDGGKIIQSFLSHALINNLTITTVPVLIGEGRPLFGSVPRDVKLTLVHSKTYDFGFVQSTYAVGSGTADEYSVWPRGSINHQETPK